MLLRNVLQGLAFGNAMFRFGFDGRRARRLIFPAARFQDAGRGGRIGEAIILLRDQLHCCHRLAVRDFEHLPDFDFARTGKLIELRQGGQRRMILLRNGGEGLAFSHAMFGRGWRGGRLRFWRRIIFPGERHIIAGNLQDLPHPNLPPAGKLIQFGKRVHGGLILFGNARQRLAGFDPMFGLHRHIAVL